MATRKIAFVLGGAFCQAFSQAANLTLEVALKMGAEPFTLAFNPTQGPAGLTTAANEFAATHGLSHGYGCSDRTCVVTKLVEAMQALDNQAHADAGVAPVAPEALLFGFEWSENTIASGGVLQVTISVDGALRVFSCPAAEPLCDVQAHASDFCAKECALHDEQLRLCEETVWRAYAEKEFLAGYNLSAERARACGAPPHRAFGAYPCDLERRNGWFENTAPRLPWLLLQSGWDLSAPARILEVGAYEGGSTTWFQRYLLAHPASSLFVVDTWQDTSDPMWYGPSGRPDDGTLDRFRRNVGASANAAKVGAVRGDSATVLAALLARVSKSTAGGSPGSDGGGVFDFAYVDGSHRASEVLVDVSLAWRLLRAGGLMLLDDYGNFSNPADHRRGDTGDTGEANGSGADEGASVACGRAVRERRELTCGEAIDAVLASAPGGAEVLHCGYNLLVRKRRGAFDASLGSFAAVSLPGASGWAAETAAALGGSRAPPAL